MASVSSELKRMNTDCAVLGHSGVSDSLQPFGLQPTRLFCPWGFSSRSVGVGCHLPPPGESSLPRDPTHISWVSSIAGRFFTQGAIRKAWISKVYILLIVKSHDTYKYPQSSIGRKKQSHTLTGWGSEESRMRGPKRNHKISKAKSHSFGVG